MNELKPGWYPVVQDGELFPARFDGDKWHHLKHNGEIKIASYEPLLKADGNHCPTGCVCTENPDGTIKVDCT